MLGGCVCVLSEACSFCTLHLHYEIQETVLRFALSILSVLWADCCESSRRYSTCFLGQKYVLQGVHQYRVLEGQAN